jgi:hypothetical protein
MRDDTLNYYEAIGGAARSGEFNKAAGLLCEIRDEPDYPTLVMHALVSSCSYGWDSALQKVILPPDGKQ